MPVDPSTDPEWAEMPEDRDILPNGNHRCTATSKQNQRRCRHAVVPGATVCRFHGGSAPQVRQQAQLRLLDLTQPALATIARLMVSSKSDRVKLAAARDLLDRAGVTADANAADTASVLAMRVIELRDRVTSERRAAIEAGPGEVDDLPDLLTAAAEDLTTIANPSQGEGDQP